MKWVVVAAMAWCWVVLGATPVWAASSPPPMGIHILHPEEIDQVRPLLGTTVPTESQEAQWNYVTVPFTLDDIDRRAQWQHFFRVAGQDKLIPLVRLATRFEHGSWQVPTRYDMVRQLQALNAYDWPTAERHVIAYNEVNHAGEWGGTIDPPEYARTLRFLLDWTATEPEQYVVLPAALDLAAPQYGAASTWDAFAFWRAVHESDPTVLADLTVWNSHSYPNPAFSAPPTATGRNSLRGFEHELRLVSELTGRELPVYITETGWRATRATERYLPGYYSYAMRSIWSHPQVRAVTPFILQGAPGPFAEFSFLSESRQPTSNYLAFQYALQQFCGEECSHLLSMAD